MKYFWGKAVNFAIKAPYVQAACLKPDGPNYAEKYIEALSSIHRDWLGMSLELHALSFMFEDILGFS